MKLNFTSALTSWISGGIKQLLGYVALVGCILILAACSSSVKELPDLPSAAERATHPNPEVEAQLVRLETASILAQEKKYQDSLGIMQTLEAGLLPTDYLWQALEVAATSSLALDDGWQTLRFINIFGDRLNRLSPTQNYRLFGYRADAYVLIGYYPQALQQRYNQARMAGSKQQQQTAYALLWTHLQRMNGETLQDLAQRENQAALRGWLELALISNVVLGRPELFTQRLEEWRIRWPRHLAQEFMPAEISLLAELSQQQVRHLGVFLPESGPLNEPAQVLRDALIARQLDDLQRGYPAPKLTFYDTQAGLTLDELYQQAQADGAEVIVGPFAKADVSLLELRSRLPLPTLALNYGNAASFTNSSLYQFGLSSENEAEQVAIKAWQSGLRRALTLTPDNAWGKRVQESFVQAWQELGGEVTYAREYGGDLNLDQALRELLEVQLSQQRHQRLTRLLGQRPHFSPRPREDSDFLFLHAEPATARQVKPALSFLMAGDLPVLATASVYNGVNNPTQDRDLNGIAFCDIPWYLGKGDNLEAKLRQTWPDNMVRYGRIYAMGVDAYLLAQRLPFLDALPASRMDGATGRLSQQQRRIKRELEWANFVQGRIEPLTAQSFHAPSLIEHLDMD